jgi:hypothetical protein
MRRGRTTEHENLVVGFVPLIYHSFDDQLALRLGNQCVDPLTTRHLVVRRILRMMYQCASARLFFSEQGYRLFRKAARNLELARAGRWCAASL